MALKFFALLALVATARGEVVGAAAALPAPVLTHVSDATYDPLPQYYFGYSVQNTLTGDSKSHIESRNGDIVLGQYSLNDPDGTRRIVDYTSDSLNGFNAVVKKIPLALVAPVVTRVAAAAVVEPALTKAIAAPLIARTKAPSAKAKSAPLAKASSVPVAPAAKAAPVVAPRSEPVAAASAAPRSEPVAVASAAPRSEPVVAKSSSDVSAAPPVAANPPAAFVPVAFRAIAYSGFAAPLAVAYL